MVFEPKVVTVAPEHLGKLSFYVNAIDDLLRRPKHGDVPTIGILIAATRDDVRMEYALPGMDTPLAVHTYTTERALPQATRTALPNAADPADVCAPPPAHLTLPSKHKRASPPRSRPSPAPGTAAVRDRAAQVKRSGFRGGS